MKIAIIGAGLAGLTAAYRLQKMGVNADVFEARNRVGGRVFSAFLQNSKGSDSVIEFGGWNILDGGKALEFFALCDEFGLKIETHQVSLKSKIYWEGQFYDLDKELACFFQENSDAQDIIKNLSEKCDSIQDFIDQLFLEYPMLKMAWGSRMGAYEGLDAKNQSIYHNLETLQCMLEGGLAKAHKAYEHEEDALIFKSIEGGNARLPEAIANSLGEKIHLRKTLRKIEKVANQFVLCFSDGAEEVFDRVILTVPASVYADIEISENMSISNRWLKMQKIAYGQNYKILIPINIDETQRFSLIRRSQISFFGASKNILTCYGNQPIPDIQEEFNIITKAYHLKKPLDAEKIKKAEAQNFVHYVDPVTHDWKTDPYAKASYSAYSTELGAELDEKVSFQGIGFKALFQPSGDGLYFAGEHTTISEYIGTMQAAVESGERAALSSLKD